MQDRKQVQQINYYPHSPVGNSSWNRANRSLYNGSVSMQRDDENSNNNNNNNNNNQQQDEENNSIEEDDDKESLSSEFNTSFTVFVSIIIILTMTLLIYSNTTDGAFVQVQVTPQLPGNSNTHSSLRITENVTPWTASQTMLLYTTSDNNTNIDIEWKIYALIEFIEELKMKYPYLRLKNDDNNDDAVDFEYLYQHKNNISKVLSELDIDPTETFKFEVFSFTLTSSIDDFWAAKAYELAFVIAAFSGAWPYIKLLLLLLIWLHPMKSTQREKGLLLLDQLGKYSFIDLYVCIFMVVSFYLTITEQTRSGLGIEVAVIVQIDTGVSTFAVATLVSMFYSMVFIYFDEQKKVNNRLKEKVKNEKHDNKDCEENEENKENEETLDVDCFQNEIEEYSKLYEWKNDNSYKIYAFYDSPSSFCGVIWRSIFLVIIIGNIWLCIDTIYTAPVRYDMKGLAGWAITDNVRAYSIKETADLLPYSTDKHGAAWFCVIQYYITVIIAPILISIVIVSTWLLPMTYKMHNIICHLLLPLQAWAALDVFLVGAVAASVELDQVSQWILNSNFPGACGDNGAIEKIFHTGCFSVEGNLIYGTILLTTFVVIEWGALLYTTNRINKTHQKFAKYKFEPIKM